MKEKKYLIFGIGITLLTLIGITLAYFMTSIENKLNNVTVKTGDLSIIFNNGEKIEGISVEPGWSITKTFSIENKSNTEYKYNLVIEDLINTFVSDNLVYKITSTNNGYNMTNYEVLPKSDTKTNTNLTYSTVIQGKTKQEYTIEIKFLEEDRNQKEDMGKTITGKLFISAGIEGPKSLAESILRDNKTISERTDFSVTYTLNTTGTIFKTNKTEDGSDVYYYAGNTTNNWVKFGNFYWRIIRTNEDGSVRLLYSGTSPDTIEGYIGTSAFNTNSNNSMYIGYMYGTSGSLENNRQNTNDSTVKIVIDKWYEDNLLSNYDKYISKSAIYCNDRSVGNGTYSATGSSFDYAADIRLYSNKTPSYKCGANTTNGLFESTQAVADKFSVSTTGGGNGKLKYGIALMTVDEVGFAGGKYGTVLTSPYAWYYTNSEGNSITDSVYWWTMSPDSWDGTGAHAWDVGAQDNPGYLHAYYFIDHVYAIRPVISLDKCAKITGSGTSTDPYIVDENTSTC